MHTVLRTGAWARLPPSMMDKERRDAAFDLTDAGEILETEKDIKENIKLFLVKMLNVKKKNYCVFDLKLVYVFMNFSY